MSPLLEEMPDRAEESFASLEKGGGTKCRRDNPPVPSGHPPFQGGLSCHRRGEHGSPETPQSSLHRIFHCNSRKNQVQSFLYKKLKFIVAKIYRS